MEQVFESERIIFIRPMLELIPDYLKMVNDIDNVAKYISDRREPYTEEEEWDYMKDKLDNDAMMFSMIEKFALPDVPVPQAPEAQTAQGVIPLREERDLMGLLGKLKNAGSAYFTAQTTEDAVQAFFFAMENEILYVPGDCFDFETFCMQFFSQGTDKYTADAKALFRAALNRGVPFRGLKMDTTLRL